MAADFARSSPLPVHTAVVVRTVAAVRNRPAGHILAVDNLADRMAAGRIGAAGHSRPVEGGSQPGCNNPGSGCTEKTLLRWLRESQMQVETERG